MFLSKEQVDNLMSIIDFTTSINIGTSLGNDQLTEIDKFNLRRYGIDPDTIGKDMTELDKAYYFGKLSAIISKHGAQSISYKDFKDHLYNKTYLPLTKLQEHSLDQAKQRIYRHIKGLGERQKKDIYTDIDDVRNSTREAYEKIIGKEIEEGIANNKNANEVARKIGKRTGEWERDWARITETEIQSITELGRADELKERYKDPLVYKQVYEGACRYCIKFFHTKGLSSQPTIFKLSQLEANGTNIGRPTKDWKPTLTAVHPYCRCNLIYLPPNMVWDKELGRFVYKKDESRKPLGIKITVGSKEFNV